MRILDLPEDIILNILCNYLDIFSITKYFSHLLACSKEVVSLFNRNSEIINKGMMIKFRYFYPCKNNLNKRLTGKFMGMLHRQILACTFLYNHRYNLDDIYYIWKMISFYKCSKKIIPAYIYSIGVISDLSELDYYENKVLYLIPIVMKLCGDVCFTLTSYDYYPKIVIKLVIKRQKNKYITKLMVYKNNKWNERKWDAILIDFSQLFINYRQQYKYKKSEKIKYNFENKIKQIGLSNGCFFEI